jgi:hypothetical protein
VPDIEYFFTDTGVELPEIYTFLDKLEIYLGRKIKRLGFDHATKTGKDFFHHLKMKDGMLPPFNILVANLILASLDKILTLSIMAIS